MSTRAMRYRRLALAEGDGSKAELLFKLAEECDRGVLRTAEWLSDRPYSTGRMADTREVKAAGSVWDPFNRFR